VVWWKIRSDPNCLLQVSEIRQIIAKYRANSLIPKGVEKIGKPNPLIATNTLAYNLDGALTASALDRPQMMIGVVCAIEKVNQNRASMDILSIGPRSEIEIFGLLGAGFQESRIKAVDLFSYSPLVDIGDMHDLPYSPSSFDIIFAGWVLAYSKDQQVVAKEMLRVARDGAIIVVAGDYSDDTQNRPTFENTTSHMESVEKTLKLFGDNVADVYFRHDPSPRRHENGEKMVNMVMTVFDIKK
jgi:SAM-dependent methyltransferase